MRDSEEISERSGGVLQTLPQVKCLDEFRGHLRKRAQEEEAIPPPMRGSTELAVSNYCGAVRRVNRANINVR